MTRYILRRLLHMIPTLALISMLSFAIIQAPPGDMLSSRLAELAETGEQGGEAALAEVEALRRRYGLDLPLHRQYWTWITNIVLRGDFGESYTYEAEVSDILGERLGLTLMLTVTTLLFSWLIAIPIGIYSATKPYTKADYSFTFVGFLGLSTPTFLVALIVMFIQVKVFAVESVGGLFSPELTDAPWSVERFVDLLGHVWVPIVIIGFSGTAGTIRILRANLMDVLDQQHIQTGRAKGLSERSVVMKYGVRIAINPLVSSLGMSLPSLLSGAVITGVVLSLPTAGPVFLAALKSQDMHLAGAFLLLSASFLLIGNLLADIALAWLDPRIRYE